MTQARQREDLIDSELLIPLRYEDGREVYAEVLVWVPCEQRVKTISYVDGTHPDDVPVGSTGTVREIFHEDNPKNYHAKVVFDDGDSWYVGLDEVEEIKEN